MAQNDPGSYTAHHGKRGSFRARYQARGSGVRRTTSKEQFEAMEHFLRQAVEHVALPSAGTLESAC